MSDLKSGDAIYPDVEFVCPFCDGKVFAAKEPPSVMHSMPPCSTFVRMEPDDFLAASRKELVKGARS